MLRLDPKQNNRRRKQSLPVVSNLCRVPQESVQIVLIFRLLLKITVDWLYNAIYKCL